MTKDKNFDTKTQVLPNIQPIVSSMDVFIRSCTTDSKPRISTGIWEFDRILNGGLSDEFYIMGAETSTGKSAFLMFIAQKIAEVKKTSLDDIAMTTYKNACQIFKLTK